MRIRSRSRPASVRLRDVPHRVASARRRTRRDLGHRRWPSRPTEGRVWHHRWPRSGAAYVPESADTNTFLHAPAGVDAVNRTVGRDVGSRARHGRNGAVTATLVPEIDSPNACSMSHHVSHDHCCTQIPRLAQLGEDRNQARATIDRRSGRRCASRTRRSLPRA